MAGPRLKKLSFKTFNREGYNDWELDGLEVDDLCLIVGQNSSGKSRIVRIITSIQSWILGRPVVKNCEGQIEIETSTGVVYKYSFSTADTGIFETLLAFRPNGEEEQLLKRNSSRSEIAQYSTLGETVIIPFDPPSDRLSVAIRRDKSAHPFNEVLAEWSSNTYFFFFSNLHPDVIVNDPFNRLYSDATEKSIAQIVSDLSAHGMKSVYSAMNAAGYSVKEVNVEESLHSQPKVIIVKESGLPHPITQGLISQGMFRTLALCVFIVYCIERKLTRTILVDDLCEGLDYKRATAFGQWLIDTCQGSGIQLIATSNDSFLMNVFPTKYWNILVREGTKVTAINRHNHPERFDSFAFTGLNNFHLFSSDFIHKDSK